MQRKKSFTLIEVIIAFSVLAIMVPLFLRALPFGAESARLASRKTQAITLCQEKIEEYISKTYAEIPVGIVEPRAPLSETHFTHFEREVEIQYVDGNLNQVADDQGLKKILVTVWWRQAGKEYTENLVTLKAKP